MLVLVESRSRVSRSWPIVPRTNDVIPIVSKMAIERSPGKIYELAGVRSCARALTSRTGFSWGTRDEEEKEKEEEEEEGENEEEERKDCILIAVREQFRRSEKLPPHLLLILFLLLLFLLFLFFFFFSFCLFLSLSFMRSRVHSA